MVLLADYGTSRGYAVEEEQTGRGCAVMEIRGDRGHNSRYNQGRMR